MDTTRFILILAIGLVIMMLIQAWEEDYGQVEKPAVEARETFASPPLEEEKKADLPSLPAQTNSTERALPSAQENRADAGFIKVATDKFDININLRGGGIDDLALLDYPIDPSQPDVPVHLLTNNPDIYYVLQGGLLSKQNAPTHDAVYSSDKNQYNLGSGQTTLRVPLRWRSSDGIEVIKTYIFRENSYVIDVEYSLENNSAAIWSGRSYGQLQRNDPNRSGHRLLYTYTGAILSSPEERYQKISFGDMEEKPVATSIKDGWAAMLQHYFVSALVPGSNEQPYYYYSKALVEENRYLIGMMSPAEEVTPGSTATFSHQLYLGPKTQRLLEQVAPRLELTVDYGTLWFIAHPLFVCLDWFHSLTGNWGFAILLVTLLIKLVFYPLSAAGYRSMANMRKVQPRLLAIRDRYKDDKARLNQAMMDLYKKEKINPLGGCFPILVQIPVFIALYWVLLESVEMRQASFILWIQDLSSPDPWYVLPVLMGISMFVQQKLNPAPMDPIQEKVMMSLPIVFTVFFAFFPSGLVLYWVANNILSIAQQWMITRQIEAAGK